MKTQIGIAQGGDFSDNTMTFEIEGEMILCAGKYEIVPIKDYDKLVKNNVVLDPVSDCIRSDKFGDIIMAGRDSCDECKYTNEETDSEVCDFCLKNNNLEECYR